jgi:hypothetical protein
MVQFKKNTKVDIAELLHTDGTKVIGSYVYRGFQYGGEGPQLHLTSPSRAAAHSLTVGRVFSLRQHVPGPEKILQVTTRIGTRYPSRASVIETHLGLVKKGRYSTLLEINSCAASRRKICR